MDFENKNKSHVWITERGGEIARELQTCEFPYRAFGGGWGAAERKSRGNMEVENITNKHNVSIETWGYGS